MNSLAPPPQPVMYVNVMGNNDLPDKPMLNVFSANGKNPVVREIPRTFEKRVKDKKNLVAESRRPISNHTNDGSTGYIPQYEHTSPTKTEKNYKQNSIKIDATNKQAI